MMAEMTDMEIEEVSAVRKASNGRRLLIIKSSEGVMAEQQVQAQPLVMRLATWIAKGLGGDGETATEPVVEPAVEQVILAAATAAVPAAPTEQVEVEKAGAKIRAAWRGKLKAMRDELDAMLTAAEADGEDKPADGKAEVKKDAALSADFQAQIGWLQAQVTDYEANIAGMKDAQQELLLKIAAFEAAVAASDTQVEKATAEAEAVRKAAGLSRALEPAASANVKKEQAFWPDIRAMIRGELDRQFVGFSYTGRQPGKDESKGNA
jgi:hypothetical protein